MNLVLYHWSIFFKKEKALNEGEGGRKGGKEVCVKVEGIQVKIVLTGKCYVDP